MNDKSMNILEQYALSILRTRKGRGAVIVETNVGTKILKEYTGSPKRILLQDTLLKRIKENGGPVVDHFVRNSQGEILTIDNDKTAYFLKDHIDGRECDIRVFDECIESVRCLAAAQPCMRINSAASEDDKEIMPVFSQLDEYKKHNRELKKVRSYILKKSQKTDFELYFLGQFDAFIDSAEDITEEFAGCDFSVLYNEIRRKVSICHGSYQHHNIIFTDKGIAMINFEKYISDTRIRDLYLFLRKFLEKNDWSCEQGLKLIEAYDKVEPLSKDERLQLYYRFSYPEKFWKIANFYYNAGKSWISGRNMEKLEKLLSQENNRKNFIKEVL